MQTALDRDDFQADTTRINPAADDGAFPDGFDPWLDLGGSD
jgi:hypothetical protein